MGVVQPLIISQIDFSPFKIPFLEPLTFAAKLSVSAGGFI